MKISSKRYCLALVFISQSLVFAQSNLSLDFRIHPAEKSFTLVCTATNGSKDMVLVEGNLLHNANRFNIMKLNDRQREWGGFGAPSGMPPNVVSLLPGKEMQWKTTEEQLQSLKYIATYKNASADAENRYIIIKWNLNRIESRQNILLGFSDIGGKTQKPPIRAASDKFECHLGFLYDANRPLDLVFLCLNGRDEAVSIGKPLTLNSVIIATSPDIEYTRELVVPDSIIEDELINPGEVREWRLAWKMVLDLIPKEDLEKIKAGGGDLDLVWKVGEFQSDPLPLSLSDPEAQAEVKPPVLKPRLFFSSRHDNYTEFDENENGSYTLSAPPQIPKVPLSLRYPDGYRYFFRIHNVEDGTTVSDIPDPERTRVEFDFSEISPGLAANRTKSSMMLMQDGFSDFAYMVFLPLAPKELFPLNVVPGRYRLYLVTREKDGTDQTRLVADFEATQGQKVQRIPLQWKSEAITFNDFQRKLLISWPGKPSLD